MLRNCTLGTDENPVCACVHVCTRAGKCTHTHNIKSSATFRKQRLAMWKGNDRGMKRKRDARRKKEESAGRIEEKRDKV